MCGFPGQLCGGRSPTQPSGTAEAHFNNSDDSLGTFPSSNNTGELKNRLTHLEGLHGCQVKDQRVRRPHVVILSGQQGPPHEQSLLASLFLDGKYQSSLRRC